jgi:hypothetical protein
MRIKLLTALTAAGIAVVANSVPAAAAPASDSGCQLPAYSPGASYHPTYDGEDFTANVDNPFFPLEVGTTWNYTGTKDGKQAVNRVWSSAATRTIDGVPTRVVQDRLYLDGRLAERTADYYTQDRCGNVWYFGEETTALASDGTLSDTAGSWLAGKDGAQPGLYMLASSHVGQKFRQEWYRGEAQDVFRVVDLAAPITVSAGAYARSLRTDEFTSLEPDVLDNKYYIAGIGQVLELAVKGPTERLELVSVQH